jgi:uncharacterized repeat protein (TIGR03803 family)
LIFDGAGNLYGTTPIGGAHATANSGGTVFELSPVSGGEWTEKVLYSFAASATDGSIPTGGVIFDANGNLYGMTSGGGANGKGAVFELTPAAGGEWTEKVLYNFAASATDGSIPTGGVIFDANGNLYGATSKGGAHDAGTVFELSPVSGGGWAEKVLYSFGVDTSDGAYPSYGVIFDANGDLYGETNAGGSTFDFGTVYMLTPAAGGAWTERVVYAFSSTIQSLDEGDGFSPSGGLIFDPGGNLYGTTVGGGCNGGLGVIGGTVFEIANVTTAAPVFSLPAGLYPLPQTVTITDATAGATIYYTTNGDTRRLPLRGTRHPSRFPRRRLSKPSP